MIPISVAHSPDADDHFLYWALRRGHVGAAGFSFTFEELDTADLNAAASAELFDIVALSAGAYPDVHERYWILSSGASIGRGFGPALVSRQYMRIPELQGKRIGIPGRTTTAAAVLRRLVPSAVTVDIPLSPYQAVFDALATGAVDAAVVIHEGQLDFTRHGCALLVDLGEWWMDRYALPLPLGINVAHMRLGWERACELDAVCSRSIAYGIAHRERAIAELFASTQTERGKLRTAGELSTYLARYANDDSVALAEDCRAALGVLYGDALPFTVASGHRAALSQT